jgi:hypothetical protein
MSGKIVLVFPFPFVATVPLVMEAILREVTASLTLDGCFASQCDWLKIGGPPPAAVSGVHRGPGSDTVAPAAAALKPRG